MPPPTQNPKLEYNVTVQDNHDIEPAGLGKFIKLQKIKASRNIPNSGKLSKTKIVKKWSEAKLTSGAKFTVENYIQYSEPTISTRKQLKPKSTKKFNWPPAQTQPPKTMQPSTQPLKF